MSLRIYQNQFTQVYLLNGKKLTIRVGKWRTSIPIQSLKIKKDTWYHVAFAWSKKRGIRIYVDGKLLAKLTRYFSGFAEVIDSDPSCFNKDGDFV